MSRSLTAQDRTSLIRLASSLPAGSAERKAILAGLSVEGSGRTLTADRFPPEAEDFNKVQDPDGFWAWTVAEAQRAGSIRLATETIGDVILFLNMAADAWERQSKVKPKATKRR